MMHSKRLLVFAVVSLSVLGCRSIKEKLAEKAAEKAVETASGGKVDIENQGSTFTVKGEKPGEQLTIGSNSKVPDNFPKDVPIYPGAKMMGTISGNTNGKESFVLTLETGDSPEKVVAFYKGKFPASGQKFETTGPQGVSFGYEDAGRMVAVIASPSGGKTSVMLSVTPKA